MKRRVLTRSLLAFLFLAAVFLACFFLTRDEPPPADADLRLVRVEVPREENGFYLLDLKEEDVYWPTADEDSERADEMTRGQNWYPELAQEIFEKNAAVLRRLDESLKAPYFLGPEFKNPEDLITSGAWRKISEVVSLRLWSLHRARREKEAFAEAIKILKLGHRFEGLQPSILNLLIGDFIKDWGIAQLVSLLTKTNLAADDLDHFGRELGSCALEDRVIKEAIKGEFQCMAKLIDDVASGKRSPAELALPPALAWLCRYLPLLQPNESKRLFAEASRSLIGKLDEPVGTWLHIDFSRLPEDEEGSWLPGRNAAGRYLFQETMQSDAKAVVGSLGDLRLSFARILIGLKCCSMKYGHPPARLKDLVPEYLSEVPLDPYDGKPLRYSAEKKTIYSVGADMKDAGGLSGESLETGGWFDRNEPTCKIEF